MTGSSGRSHSEHVDTILRAVALIARRLHRRHFQGELTPAERSALANLSHRGSASSAQLARAEQIRPQSMGVTLAGLEARGIIRRESDTQDRRRIVFSMTTAGSDLLSANLDARADAIHRAITENFSSREQQTLERAAPLLERLGRLL